MTDKPQLTSDSGLPSSDIGHRTSVIRHPSSVFDVCIIGAGVAGGAMAAYLGKHGIQVAVIEKSLAEQERIVGELLQPGGVIKLEEMQLDHLLDGFDAQLMEGYALFMNGENFQLSYPAENGKAVTGRGFRNGKFVQKIRSEILQNKNITVFEGSATELIETEGKVTGVKFISKENKEETVVSAKLTVVSDGMFSIFREGLSENKKQVSSYFLGLVLHNAELPFKNHGHVIVAEPSPCLVYPISATETRVLIDFPWSEAPRKSPELTAYLTHTIAPQMPPQIASAFMAAVEEGKFKVMPNHLMSAKPNFKPGVALLGDSLNMRHPLTGGGMTVAFTDVQNLGNRLIELKGFESEEQVSEAVKQFYATRHSETATINILADALYGVMRNEDLKAACYSYLKRGGVYAEEPVSILSAISRDVTMLLRHFFAVAVFGIKNIIGYYPTLPKLKRSYRMLHDAMSIVSPLVMNEKPNKLTRYALRFGRFVF